MSKEIKIIAQLIDSTTGELDQETTLIQETLKSPKSMKSLGYNHKAQIKILQKAQDFKLLNQEKLINHSETCPQCGKKNRKQGKFISPFHAIFTDHQLEIQRRTCPCGWRTPYTVEGLFGSALHPDLLERQGLLGAEHSYKAAQKILAHESVNQRPINNDDRIKRTISRLGEIITDIKTAPAWGESKIKNTQLIINVDGEHLSSKDKGQRSFEAMIGTVYSPSSIKTIDKHHRKIMNKTSIASARDDKQKTMKLLFKNACLQQGMTKNTEITALTDGAKNCWSIVNSIEDNCKNLIKILDWFHIGKKFREREHCIPEAEKELFEKVKWHLWHGHPNTSLIRLEQLKLKLGDDEKALGKLKEIEVYILNNKPHFVNYHSRRIQGKSYTSHVAESSINSLINSRQKQNQKMQWSRVGAHDVLQLRTSLFSGAWEKDWDEVADKIYKEAA